MQGIHYCCLNIPLVLLMVQVIRAIFEREKKILLMSCLMGLYFFRWMATNFRVSSHCKNYQLANQDGVSKNLLARKRKKSGKHL